MLNVAALYELHPAAGMLTTSLHWPARATQVRQLVFISQAVLVVAARAVRDCLAERCSAGIHHAWRRWPD
jgi:hypothetical protein